MSSDTRSAFPHLKSELIKILEGRTYSRVPKFQSTRFLFANYSLNECVFTYAREIHLLCNYKSITTITKWEVYNYENTYM